MHLCGKGGCGVSPAGEGRWSFSSAQSRCDHTGVLCPVLGSSAQERYGHTGVSAVKATKLFRDWTWFSADSWTPMGILLLSITTIGKDWKGRARLLTEVSRTRMRDNKHCKFWLGVSIFYWFYYLHIFFLPWEWSNTRTGAQKRCQISILGHIQNLTRKSLQTAI